MKYVFLIFYLILFLVANLFLFDKCFDLLNTKSTTLNLLGFTGAAALIIYFIYITLNLFKNETPA